MGRTAWSDRPWSTNRVELDPPRPARGGAHRRESERRWPWLAALAGVFVLAAFGLLWLLGSLAGSGGETGRGVAVSGSGAPRPTGQDSAVGTRSSAAPTSAGSLRTPAASTPASSVSATAAVTATVSRTPAPPVRVTVPNVIGQRQGAAAATLRGAGLAVSTISVSTTDRRLLRRVVGQQPAGGQVVPEGSVVTIYVAATYAGR